MAEHYGRTLLSALLAALLGVMGCGDDDGGSSDVDMAGVDMGGGGDMGTEDMGGDDAGMTDMGDPRVQACRTQTEAKATANEGSIGDFPITDAPEMVRADGDQALEADYAGFYRDDLATHPGCAAAAEYNANSEPFVFDNAATVPAGAPASITGYPCAAKEYDQDSEDTDKPIVILVHGNSSGVTTFEEYANAALVGMELTTTSGFTYTATDTAPPQLATQLLGEGHRVISFDARIDRVATNVTDYNPDPATGNPFANIDHGWAVPMLQSLIKAVMTNNPDREVSIVGHSLGVTVVRDALRRLFVESQDGVEGAVNPFAQLKDVVLASGANHGVSLGQFLCETFLNNMRGAVGCEMGDRENNLATYFTQRLNGPMDLYATPCADGDYAFGVSDACDGNVVEYTTITMEDLEGGALQDEFVSEFSSSLDQGDCVDNELIATSDFALSGYFTSLPDLQGIFANHFGSTRSAAGITLILDKIAD
ncbi:MAG: alpha/beta hydrolase [Myxococcota bacterium]